jgi:hypothetical protein
MTPSRSLRGHTPLCSIDAREYSKNRDRLRPWGRTCQDRSFLLMPVPVRGGVRQACPDRFGSLPATGGKRAGLPFPQVAEGRPARGDGDPCFELLARLGFLACRLRNVHNPAQDQDGTVNAAQLVG